MKLAQVLLDHGQRPSQPDATSTATYLLGAVSAEENYPMSPGPIRVLSEKYDLVVPPPLGEALLECAESFNWVVDIEPDMQERIDAALQLPLPEVLVWPACEVWRETGRSGERWMLLHRFTFNRIAAIEVLRIAGRTSHFMENTSRYIESHWRWFAASGGLNLAVIEQWTTREMPCSEMSGRRTLHDSCAN
jgi:hypothetical protein